MMHYLHHNPYIYIFEKIHLLKRGSGFRPVFLYYSFRLPMTTVNVLLICSILFYTCNAAHKHTVLPKFPAILIFGDSVMDTGNNNYILTWVKADYLPYGQDFAHQVPTGRFSNGKLIPDMLASILGIKDAVPPFLDPNLSDDDLITGVNFASAGSGFDDSTSIFSRAIPVPMQIQFFKDYIRRLKGVVGEEEAMKIVNSALIILSAGTNDWFFNFYDIPLRRLQFNVSGYQDFLLNKLENFTKELYDLGCRSMLVSGLAPTGCLPVQMMRLKLQNPSRRHCLEDQNRDSQVYNEKLVKLLTRMQATLPGSKIVYNDFYSPVTDMITHPQKYGFTETKKGCCESDTIQTGWFLCDPWASACKDPSKFLFWDMIHPTLEGYQCVVRFMVEIVLPHFLSKN